MKKSLYLLLITIALFACKKDENADNEKQIVKDRVLYKVYLPSDNSTIYSTTGDFKLNILSDKTFYSTAFFFLKHTGNWELISNNTQLHLYDTADTKTYDIIHLDTELHLKDTENGIIYYLK